MSASAHILIVVAGGFAAYLFGQQTLLEMISAPFPNMAAGIILLCSVGPASFVCGGLVHRHGAVCGLVWGGIAFLVDYLGVLLSVREQLVGSAAATWAWRVVVPMMARPDCLAAFALLPAIGVQGQRSGWARKLFEDGNGRGIRIVGISMCGICALVAFVLPSKMPMDFFWWEVILNFLSFLSALGICLVAVGRLKDGLVPQGPATVISWVASWGLAGGWIWLSYSRLAPSNALLAALIVWFLMIPCLLLVVGATWITALRIARTRSS